MSLPRREDDIITQIALIRARNNEKWMQIVEIALEHAPEKTKAVMRQINSNDSAISSLWKDLAQ